MKWNSLTTAPNNTPVLIVWGTNSNGAAGLTVAFRHNGVWREISSGDRIETEGFRALAWMPLPELPSLADLKEFM